jgi:hypothetical protein
MRASSAFWITALVACGGQRTAESAPVAIPPLGAKVEAVVTARPCAIEGDGEPVDTILFHQMPALTLSATRQGPPLLRTQGDARHHLPGRWSEITPHDGRARLELTRSSAFRITGYSDLSAVRFRLRRDVAVVPDHVFLQAEALVRIVGGKEHEIDISSDVPFSAPKELRARVKCEDLGYERVRSKYEDAPQDAVASITELSLFDAPRGRVVFEGNVGLMWVIEHERRDDFVWIEGARHRVRLTGWVPRAQVDRTPRGGGSGAGGRSFSSRRGSGKKGRIARETPLFARRPGEAPAIMGELLAGSSVLVGTEASSLVVVEIDGGEIVAEDGAEMIVRASDVEHR